MKDYRQRPRDVPSAKHIEVLREVAINESKRVIVACAPTPGLGKDTHAATGSSRMSCYRLLKSEGLIQPKRIGHDLRQAASSAISGSQRR